MAKAVEKRSSTAENVEFPSFDNSKASDQFRAVAEKGVEQSREAFSRLKSGAEDAHKAMEASYERVRSVGSEMSLKAIAAMRANAEANFSHLEALMNAKSLSEMFELQAMFLRQRVEMAVEQAREFQTVTSKAAEDVSRPLRDVFEKSVRELKAA